MQNLIQKEKGFTLVETLVAITILVTAIAGPMTIAAQSLVGARIARQQLVATYLAQEGIELIRLQRDNNIILGENAWTFKIGDCQANRDYCYVNDATNPGVITRCDAADGCPVLNINDGIGALYTYTPIGQPSEFTRRIEAVVVEQSQEIKVISMVSWETPFSSKSVTIEDTITNWHEDL